MKLKISLTDKMKPKITALIPGKASSRFTVKTVKEMRACYRAADDINAMIFRQKNFSEGGWYVYRAA